METDTSSAFEAALTHYRSRHLTRTDEGWANNAQSVADIIALLGRMPQRGDAPAPLLRWIDTQRARIGTPTTGSERARAAKHVRDGDRAEVLNAMPGWVWDPREAAADALTAELTAFVRQHNRPPAYSRRIQRDNPAEANLARRARRKHGDT